MLMQAVLYDVFGIEADPSVQEWLDAETRVFIEMNSEAADDYHDWLTDICGLDDLFDVGGEMQAWWRKQVREFRAGLLSQLGCNDTATRNIWPEDYELKSRRQLAFVTKQVDYLI
jgi:hypothetical protein